MDTRLVPLVAVMDSIPEKKRLQLEKKGFKTLEDFLRFFPNRYEMRGEPVKDFRELCQYVKQQVSVVGTIVDVNCNYAKSFLTIRLHDSDERPLSVTWFHQNYLASRFRTGMRIKVFGVLNFDPKYGYKISSPIAYGSPDEPDTPLPIYSKIPGMSDEYLKSCIDEAIRFSKIATVSDVIPDDVRASLGIDDYITFVEKAHGPRNEYDINAVNKRKCAETLLPFVIKMTQRQMENKTTTNKIVPATKAKAALQQFLGTLPFSLTEDQTSTLNEVQDVISSGKRLDALVQGDVGCGKTMVAAGAAAIMTAGGFQVAILAPTTVLASQHYEEFKDRFAPLGQTVVFLGGKEKAKEKRETLKKIKDGTANIIIGTHAIFADGVEFHSLGLTIADEEHRFGVEQREKLRQKSLEGAHHISMTATPIPRTLALAIYGDSTRVFSIHSMPAGRKPVITQIQTQELKVYEGLYREVKKGHQCYLVCPLITAADNEKMADVESLEETEAKMREYFADRPEVRIAVINGKMKEDDIKATISAFAKHEYDILLSTTIVEVGVNVPNATVMLIKNAERFGLAQLHQLRGRVGRGSLQSFCILLSPYRDRPRLQIMVRTTDGFEIAKEDLALRGTGNLVGTAQSGIDKAVTNMVQYPKFYDCILRVVKEKMKTRAGFSAMMELDEALTPVEEPKKTKNTKNAD